jgi:hypothetical protein
MLGNYPFKVGDKLRSTVPGNPKGIATVLKVEEIRDDRNELVRQHLCITAPLNSSDGVWIIARAPGDL